MDRGFGLALSAASSWAQVPVDQLAKPPADAKRYVIMSTAGKHGEASEWTAPDGTRWARASLVLRGQVWEIDEAAKLGSDGMVAHYAARGVSPQGDIGETFAVAGGNGGMEVADRQGFGAVRRRPQSIIRPAPAR